ncbi:hypothetical protein BaRGS_00008929 [Batillaria attramentaria]|uniref:Uncharacterized protein n=1 Tax=Batillaria attramentaria TaxID=370345 RepID=A0ABD0LKA9_9CAEN
MGRQTLRITKRVVETSSNDTKPTSHKCSKQLKLKPCVFRRTHVSLRLAFSLHSQKMYTPVSEKHAAEEVHLNAVRFSSLCGTFPPSVLLSNGGKTGYADESGHSTRSFDVEAGRDETEGGARSWRV